MDRGARAARALGAARPGVGPWELRAPAAVPPPDGGMAADRRLATAARGVLRGGALRQGSRGGPRRLSGLDRCVRGAGRPSRTPRPPPPASPGRSTRTARSPTSGRSDRTAAPAADPLPAAPASSGSPSSSTPSWPRTSPPRCRRPATSTSTCSIRRVSTPTGTSRSGTTSRPGTTSVSTGAAQARRRGRSRSSAFPPSCCPGTRSARLSCPGIRWAVASARPSPSASAPRFWGSRSTGCAGTSASRRSPPSGGGSWSRSRRRSWSTPATCIRRSRGRSPPSWAPARCCACHTGAGRRWRS